MSINCPECGQNRGAENFLEGAVQRGAELMGEVESLKARVAELEEQYGELIFAVATKYPDETRHQTALRYIQQSENREASPACELKP